MPPGVYFMVDQSIENKGIVRTRRKAQSEIHTMRKSDSDIIVPLYEDNHLLAINKPSGYLCQGDKTGDMTLLDYAKDYIKKRYNKPGNVFLGLCHRLDRPVSGVLLLARTSKGLERINKLFSQGEVRKTYMAVSTRAPKAQSGQIEHWLVKDGDRNLVTASTQPVVDGKKAITSFKVVSQADRYFMTELHPVTGRSHQLRVAMKSLKAPILGDVKYGGSVFDQRSIALHCRSMQFIHPVTKELLRIEAPFPDQEPWVYF